jgi:hypothetical protein
MRRITKAATVAAATLIAIGAASTAHASVTIDSTGRGFAGKGDVQTAFGWNNQKLQTNAGGLSFTTQQAASQALAANASQSGRQTATQSVSEDVTCDLKTGHKTFHRDGDRTGVATGSRSGDRTGSRAGSLGGTLSYNIAFDARQRNQITGFNLTGFQGGSSFAPSGDEVWNDPTFDDWSFGGYAWGDTEWGGWDAAPGENPADCLGGNPGVTNLVDTFTNGDIVDSDPVGGAVSYGDTEYGDTTESGPISLFVTFGGATKPL